LPTVSPALSAAVAASSLLLAVLALVLATIANRRWARRPRGQADHDATSHAGSGSAPLDEQSVARLRTEVDHLAAAVGDLRAGAATAERTALRHVAVVRYDAFADVGGRLSYSLAVLDDTGSGFVLTALAGKTEVRTYVRAISAGSGEGTLTAEEQQAIDAAVAGAPGSQP
jgi:hypothetical protein